MRPRKWANTSVRPYERDGLFAVVVIALFLLSIAALRVDLNRALRDDFAAAAAFVSDHARPGDTVIVIPDWGQEAFKFHFAALEGALPVTGIFPRLSPEVDYAPALESLSAGYERVWLVRYQPEVSDADGLADAFFAARGVVSTRVYPAGMEVVLYDQTPQRSELPAYARPLDAQFGERVALRGVDLPVTYGTADDTRLHPPSGWVNVTLYWEALRTEAAFIPQVRLTDSLGQVWGAALERGDGLLARYPVATWTPGEVWRAAYDINLNPQTPPGVYNVEVMALDPQTGQPLESSGTDAGERWVIAGQFTIGG